MEFPVRVDGKFHGYSLHLKDPVAMDSLRLDPVSEPDTEVWIEAIEFYRPGQPAPRVVRLEPFLRNWEIGRDIERISIEDGALYFRSRGSDPSLRIPNLNEDQVTEIRIRMKAWLKPAFLQWLFCTASSRIIPAPGDCLFRRL